MSRRPSSNNSNVLRRDIDHGDPAVPLVILRQLADCYGFTVTQSDTRKELIFMCDYYIKDLAPPCPIATDNWSRFPGGQIARLCCITSRDSGGWRKRDLVKVFRHIKAAERTFTNDLFKAAISTYAIRGMEMGYISSVDDIDVVVDPLMVYAAIASAGSYEDILPHIDDPDTATMADVMKQLCVLMAYRHCNSKWHSLRGVAMANALSSGEVAPFKADEEYGKTINRAVRMMGDMSAVGHLLTPANNSQAVAAAVVIFGIDTSMSECPMMEFLLMELFDETGNGGLPYGFVVSYDLFCRGGAIVVGSYAVSTLSNFNILMKFPNAAACVVDKMMVVMNNGYEPLFINGMLKGFKVYEGCVGDSTAVVYETAEEAYASYRKGVSVGFLVSDMAKSSETPVFREDFLEEIFPVNPDKKWVSVWPGEDSGLDVMVYSLEEFIETIERRNSFSIPCHDGETFVVVSCRALTTFLQTLETMEESAAFARLTAVMESMESFYLYAENLLKMAVAKDKLANVCAVFRRLADAGFAMRGWRGGAYPLTSEESMVPTDDFGAVAVAVTEAIAKYDTALNAITDSALREAVNRSLLVKAVSTSAAAKSAPPPLPSFEPSHIVLPDGRECFTIADRMSLVKEGEGADSLYSCMRMTSNIFVATAWYYNRALREGESLFNIARLTEIF